VGMDMGVWDIDGRMRGNDGWDGGFRL
jgi:hypothetical protein